METSFSGKNILITGSTDGLGKLVAQHLASQGAAVLLHGRNEEKGIRVRDEIIKITNNLQIKYYNAELSSLTDVNRLSKELLKDLDHLDVLINNAGIGRGIHNKREISKDGIELRFAVNYLSHVLLTQKLLSRIPDQTGRIINVSSIGQEALNFDDLMLEKNYDGYLAYKQSKAAQIMYTIDLAERLNDRGIKVNAVHPSSLMNTKMVLDEWGYSISTVAQGAEAVENLLHCDTTGAYYDQMHIAKAIPQVYDIRAREKLSEITRHLLKAYL